jgi:hypothetical protein
MTQRVIAGVGWYSKDQWPEYRRLMADEVDETHEAWLEKALKAEKELRKKGVEIERVPVDLADFDLWCTTHKRKRDGAARAAYVCEKINRK